MALSVGARLGPYEIVGAIGAGGMGEVYKARDTRLDLVRSPSKCCRRSSPKIRSSRSVSNAKLEPSRSSIIRTSARFTTSEKPRDSVLADRRSTSWSSSALEGKTLATRLQHGRLDLAEALRIAREIADGLARAHQHGIVHRDLKPGNIMLTKTGAKLLDFGLAKSGVIEAVSSDAVTAERSGDVVTARGTILGTFQSMAPEQIEGGHADERSDIFALGTVLYEMLTGRKAFQGSSDAGVLSAILKDNPPPVSQFLSSPPLPSTTSCALVLRRIRTRAFKARTICRCSLDGSPTSAKRRRNRSRQSRPDDVGRELFRPVVWSRSRQSPA